MRVQVTGPRDWGCEGVRQTRLLMQHAEEFNQMQKLNSDAKFCGGPLAPKMTFAHFYVLHWTQVLVQKLEVDSVMRHF